MKPESKFWQIIKKNTPKIQWTRLESWSSFGTPDLLGYHDSCGFFMCEMKIARGPRISFSPHQKLFHQTRTKRNFIIVQEASSGLVKLYESSAIHGLLTDHRETPCLALDDWDHIQRLLLDACPDAWGLLLEACSLLLAAWRLTLVACRFGPRSGRTLSLAVAVESLIAGSSLLRSLRNSL